MSSSRAKACRWASESEVYLGGREGGREGGRGRERKREERERERSERSERRERERSERERSERERSERSERRERGREGVKRVGRDMKARHHSLVYSPLVKLGSTLIPSQVVLIHVNRRHKQLVPKLPTQHKSSTGTQCLQEIFV